MPNSEPMYRIVNLLFHKQDDADIIATFDRYAKMHRLSQRLRQLIRLGLEFERLKAQIKEERR